MRQYYFLALILIAHAGFIACSQSSNTKLKYLKLSTGELIPAFHPDTLTYSVSCLNVLNDMTVSAEPEDTDAELSVDDTYKSGESFRLDSIGAGRMIRIKVTAPGGDVKIYQIRTLPADFPQPKVLVSNNPSEGSILLSSFSFANLRKQPMNGHYLMIISNSGRVEYYKKLSTAAMDFKHYNDGMYSYNMVDSVFGGMAFGYTVIMNKNFIPVDTFRASSGMSESHEFLRLPGNGALMIAVIRYPADLSSLGGEKNSWVFNALIEGQDNTGKIVFRWSGKDFFSPADVTPDITLNSVFIPVSHPNSLAVLANGNILLSSRHQDEITCINPSTGKSVWRMGGKHCRNNQFKIENDPLGGFSHQHSVQVLPNGNLLMYDNGNLHGVTNPDPINLPGKQVLISAHKTNSAGHCSRVAEYSVNEKAMVAELVWQYSDSIYGDGMGSVQRLSNGNTIICWGNTYPTLTEVTPDGKKVLVISLPEGYFTNRIYKSVIKP